MFQFRNKRFGPEQKSAIQDSRCPRPTGDGRITGNGGFKFGPAPVKLPLTSSSEIGEGERGVVHAVGEVRYGHDQDQLDDLLFREVLLQGGQVGLAHRAGGARHLIGKMNDGLFLFIE